MYKRVLLRLPEKVMPHFQKPLLLADFLTDGYGQGGLNAILSLSSLFILMRCHNLDYPHFFESLYRTLTPTVFYAKHRSRYFRLLTVCLASASIPAYTLAAFLKRLCRLALSAPPSGALYALALTRNALQKNKEMMPLIRETPAHPPAARKADVFDMAAEDPKASRALESCLWELLALRQHYHPAVSALCKDLERLWDKHEQKLSMEEYTSCTYRELFELESTRKMKSAPLAFAKPAGLLKGPYLSSFTYEDASV